MRTQKIHIPIFDYDLTVVEIEVNDNGRQLSKLMKGFECKEEDIDSQQEYIDKHCMDGGNCFRNLDKKSFLVILLPCTSEGRRRNVLAHELRHVVDRLCEHINIEDIETPAYITGYIYEKLK